MTMPVQEKANTEDTAVTRTDLGHLLQEVGSSDQLDVSGQDVRGIDLMNCNWEGANLSQARVCAANLCGVNLSKADLQESDLRGASLDKTDLRGADLSWASLGGASACARTKSHLRRSYALGIALGLPCMSVGGFMMVLGIRTILLQMRLHTHAVNH